MSSQANAPALHLRNSNHSLASGHPGFRVEWLVVGDNVNARMLTALDWSSMAASRHPQPREPQSTGFPALRALGLLGIEIHKRQARQHQRHAPDAGEHGRLEPATPTVRTELTAINCPRDASCPCAFMR
jgi:hypothetical protein